MAVTIIGRSDHSWRGSLAATVARRCSAAGSSMASHSSPNTPIARCRSAGEVAAAPMALIRSMTVDIGRDGARSPGGPPGGTCWDSTDAMSLSRGEATPQLGRGGGAGGGADQQIGGHREIDTGFGKARDDADQPRVFGGTTAAEHQSNVFNHLPSILARGHSVHRDIKAVPHGRFCGTSRSRV